MIEVTLAEIAAITGGDLVGDPSVVVSGALEFDSRELRPGGLFLALPGERVDGHEYLNAAASAGAVAAIVTRPVDSALPQVVVGDGIDALTALASALVRRLPDLVVIGVTGSSGKTSTKDLLAQVLATAGPTVAPPGSFNNELGHPYTVLRADTRTRFLVLEKSARGIGHIRHLTEIAPPRIGVVLNVGSAHLGEFGSREAIARAKGELVEALPADGLAVLNADDPLVSAMRSRTAARVITVGTSSTADVRAEDVRSDELGRPAFTLVAGGASANVALRLSGVHHVGNALAVAAVALECGLTLAGVAGSLSDAAARSRWRMETTERADGVLVINDAYNANPESMRAALESLATVGAARHARTIAVLGEMAELGPDSPGEHEAIGRRLAELGIAHLIAVGDAARPIVSGAALQGSTHTDWVPDAGAALEKLSRRLGPRDVVLVKASRAASLERVAVSVAQDVPAAARARDENERGARA